MKVIVIGDGNIGEAAAILAEHLDMTIQEAEVILYKHMDEMPNGDMEDCMGLVNSLIKEAVLREHENFERTAFLHEEKEARPRPMNQRLPESRNTHNRKMLIAHRRK